MSTVKINLV